MPTSTGLQADRLAGAPILPQTDVPRHIALLGNALPRLCGLATFTTHVREALAVRYPAMRVDHIAMVDPGRHYAFPAEVCAVLAQEDRPAYAQAAARIAASGAELLWVQHEYGIYGGPQGEYLLDLLDGLDLPVVVTLHTVLEHPDPAQLRVLGALVRRASLLVVMADKARDILERRFDVPAARIAVIPHGVPDRPYVEPATMRDLLGLEQRKTILTFGLLSPGKGLETMIRALPAIVERCPEALYAIVGATHPHLVAQAGEAYRERLMRLAETLGVAGHLRWDAHFLDEAALLDRIAAADIYVTPYTNPAQITSGTLSYAYGLGKPIVSTSYVHAAELLAGGRGMLIGFDDPPALAGAVGDLLADDAKRAALAKRAFATGHSMTWAHMVERTMARCAELARPHVRAGRAQPAWNVQAAAMTGLLG